MKALEFTVLSLLLFSISGWSQVSENQAPQQNTVPIYRTTVIGRTIQAINYEHRSGPTKIGFRGTILAPFAGGEAAVEAQRGATVIDAKFDHLAEPGKFGAEYLTYVLWAITPEGRTVNLGEVVPGPSDKAKLHVSADLQAFGLMVTAEPYFSVTHPSDVVVLENVVRPDTVGQVQAVAAKYELLPRGSYTYNVPPSGAQAPQGEKVSMPKYEAIVALYQAQNAVQIAKSEGADRYAMETIRKADQLLRQAEDYQSQNVGSKEVVTVAREATQTAEDARMITTKRVAIEHGAEEGQVAAQPSY